MWKLLFSHKIHLYSRSISCFESQFFTKNKKKIPLVRLDIHSLFYLISTRKSWTKKKILFSLTLKSSFSSNFICVSVWKWNNFGKRLTDVRKTFNSWFFLTFLHLIHFNFLLQNEKKNHFKSSATLKRWDWIFFGLKLIFSLYQKALTLEWVSIYNCTRIHINRRRRVIKFYGEY